MQILALILSGLAMAQAWDVTFYDGDSCSGRAYHAGGTQSLSCGSAPGTGGNFDARSVRYTLPAGCEVYIFTDNNSQCVLSYGAGPKTQQGALSGQQCTNLDRDKSGKWKNFKVECN